MNEQTPQPNATAKSLLERRSERNLPAVIAALAKRYAELDNMNARLSHVRGTESEPDQTLEASLNDNKHGLRVSLRQLNSSTTRLPWMFVQKQNEDGHPVGQERIFGFSPNFTDELTELNPVTKELKQHHDTDVDPETGLDYGLLTDLYVETARSIIDDRTAENPVGLPPVSRPS